MESAGYEHYLVIEGKLAAPETIFDNTIFFDPTYSMFDQDAKGGYLSVFFLLLIG